MNKLEVGMYVRTKTFGIGKITKIEPFMKEYTHIYLDSEKGDITYQTGNGVYKVNDPESIIKSSYNIIDLIEEGDYVNGLPVESIDGTWEDENDLRVYVGVATYGNRNKLPYHKYVVKDEFENDYDLRFRCIKTNDIKSIVTKEQFESMKYEVSNE